MPEGPECRIITDYLRKTILNKTITNWVFCNGKYTDDYPVGYKLFNQNLPFLITDIQCKGKMVYFILKDEEDIEHYILHYPKMTGKWQKNYDNYCKWYIEVNQKGERPKKETIWFSDSRGFGTLEFTDSKAILNSKVDNLGPDIMKPEFKLPIFKEIIKKYLTRNITAFLSDQEIISGCGNYIKSEALYYAKISPLRKVSTLTQKEIELLYESLRIISRISYNNMGIDKKSYYKSGLECKIYCKDNAICAKTADGKTTYWDKKIQS